MAAQGKTPAQPDDSRHEKARDLGEEALGELAKGHEAKADRLIEQAKQIDEAALREVVEDLDEDAGNDHAVPKDSKG